MRTVCLDAIAFLGSPDAHPSMAHPCCLHQPSQVQVLGPWKAVLELDFAGSKLDAMLCTTPDLASTNSLRRYKHALFILDD